MDFLNSLKTLIKLEKIRTDNNTFKLHYRFTVILLIISSILVTSKQYFGEPIKCDVLDEQTTVETYCWIYGTFTLKGELNREYFIFLLRMFKRYLLIGVKRVTGIGRV